MPHIYSFILCFSLARAHSVHLSALTHAVERGYGSDNGHSAIRFHSRFCQYNLSIDFLFTMADPFSIAASSFAVVGVADIVLRASIECCRFLSEIKGAPAEIDRLQTRIKENMGLVDTLKEHLNDLRTPASAMSLSVIDSSSALDGFNSSVRAIHREQNALRALAKRYGMSDKTWARVK
jgi:hypothetical protein